MKVVLASISDVKVAAINKAFKTWGDVEIVTVKADSGINEQPLNDETLRGARNRLNHAKKLVPGADYYVSIENGLFEESGDYIDRAVVTVMDGKGRIKTMYSDGVKFPKDSVEETRRRGFDKWTVGKVMQEQGIVEQHNDPHLTLVKKSRAAYIDETVKKAVSSLKKPRPPQSRFSPR